MRKAEPPDVPAPPAASSVTIKAGERARARSRRRQLTLPDDEGESLRTARVLALPEVVEARTVAAYAAVGREPATEQLLRRWREAGVRVLLPVVLPDLDLDWADDLGPRRPGAGPGVPEPVGPRLGPDAIALADVVIVPALAVDRGGRRLGQGGGSYDRALTRRRPGTATVALLHDGEIRDDVLPIDPHDIGVDLVVSPHETWRVPRSPIPS